jgi:predicted nicotinamide N-methyase
MPGLITRGQYRDSFPLLPRILLRNCDLRGTTCLDLGSMEGLMAILMCRQGAKAVLATDAIDHCGEKMAALRYYYKANFEFQQIGAGKRFTQWSNVVKSDIPQDWQMPRIYSYYSRPFARY